MVLTLGNYLPGCDVGQRSAPARQEAAPCSTQDEAGGAAGTDCSELVVAGAGAVRELLPAYYDFISAMKQQGYAFMDFASYWDADKQDLPQKLLVVRHDVHGRDIDAAYAMRRIERELLPQASATYFVMLGHPPELHDLALQRRYRDVIAWLGREGVDVEPHLSPNDLYIATYHPRWAKDSFSKLRALTNGEYTIEQHDDGVDIQSAPGDLVDFPLFDGRLVAVLSDFNQRWAEQTGLVPRFYASHGSRTPINRVLNNATLLDQRELLATGVYEFDTYNTQIHRYIGDLSDNDQPAWMEQPATIAAGRYEFLAHPARWTPSEVRAQLEREEAEQGEAGGAPP